MKRTTSLPLALAGLLLCVTACEIDENRDIGVLFVSAVDANNPTGAYLSGQILVDGQIAAEGTGMGWDPVEGLNLDATYRVSFQAPYYHMGTQEFQFSGTERDSIRFYLAPASADSVLPVSVRTFASGELTGLPIQLDGEELEEVTPATIYVSRGHSHTIAIASDRCSFADTSFIAEAGVDELEMSFNSDPIVLSFAPGALDAELIYREAATGLTGDQALNSTGAGLVAAFRDGFVASPAAYHFDSACDQTFSFTWSMLATGFDTGVLFPDFELAEVQTGESVTLRQFRGQVVLLTFWFINCPACNEEMPMFQELLAEYGELGFQVLALNPLTADFAQLPDWVEDHPQYQFRFLLDAGDTPLAQQMGITAFPVNRLLGPDGVTELSAGQLDRDTLEPEVQRLLGLNP